MAPLVFWVCASAALLVCMNYLSMPKARPVLLEKSPISLNTQTFVTMLWAAIVALGAMAFALAVFPSARRVLQNRALRASLFALCALGCFACAACVSPRSAADYAIHARATLAMCAFWMILAFGMLLPGAKPGRAFWFALIPAVSICLAFLLWSINLSAAFGMTDDHEYAKYLGPDHQMAWSEIPSLLRDTEVFEPFQSTRYRPFFYPMRMVEARLLTDVPSRYYLSRIAIYAAAFALMWLLLARGVGYASGLGFSLMVAAPRYWYDIWARLGAAETYALPGVVMLVFGFAELVRAYTGRAQRKTAARVALWLVWLMGVVVSAGSKENFAMMFLLILPVMGVVLIRRIPTQREKILAFVIVLVGLAYSAFVSAAVGVALAAAGADIYGNNVSLTLRVSRSFARMFAAVGANAIPLMEGAAGLAALGVLARWRGRQAWQNYLRALLWLVLPLVLLMALYWSQDAFYYNTWPMQIRYDFPGALALPLTWFFIAVFGLRVVRILVPTRWAALGLSLIIFALAGRTVSQADFWKQVQLSQENASASAQFNASILTLRDALRKAPQDYLLIVTSGSPEPPFSTTQFLRFYGANNPVYVNSVPPNATGNCKLSSVDMPEAQALARAPKGCVFVTRVR